MERVAFTVVVASITVLLTASPAPAHHSFAAVFDANQPVSVRGVITEVRLENPHSWFFIDVTRCRRQGGEMELRSQHADLPHPQRGQAGLHQTWR